MNSVESLKGTDMPVALIAGERDTLIPPTRTEALRRKVPNLVFDRTIAGAGHNDIYERPEFRQAMQEAIDAYFKALATVLLLFSWNRTCTQRILGRRSDAR